MRCLHRFQKNCAAVPVLLVVLVVLASCGESMDRQNRLKTYGQDKPLVWPGPGEALAPPEGAVSQDALARDATLANPPKVTAALLMRGRRRYDIYCAACHGLTGAGDGMVVMRGFPAPVSFSTPGQMALSGRHIVDTISHGYGRMYDFADRVEPQDRWAIAAYIRALQLASKPAGGR
jgi:mono/diheme cytochrome c family protein